MEEEVQLDVIEDEVLGVMFRSDVLPLKKEIVLEDGRTASVEVDQTSFTFTVDDESRTITANEMMAILESIEAGEVGAGNIFDEWRIEEVKRIKKRQYLHALNEDGMLVCNPRDKEAAHRAEMEGIGTENYDKVTCPKCLKKIKNDT